MRLLILLIALPLTACAPRQTLAPTSPLDEGRRVVAERGAVTTAHPLASEAGVEMLRAGGNAVDAAVAAGFAVSVGEPQMSGLGGGGAMLVWLQGAARAEYLDFYAAQRPASFAGLTRDEEARLREVGIPGQVAGLLEAHERFGRLPRAAVLAPAIRLAEEGVPVSQVLAQMIRMDSAKLARYDESSRVFFPGGRALLPGELLRQPELAAALRRVAERGREGFYAGETAEQVVRALNAGGHPATARDLAGYRPQWRRPVCGEYRGHTVLSAAPPQTGLQIVHTLELLEPYDLRALGLPTRSARAFDVLTSALRAGMTVGRQIDDPAWAAVPARELVSAEYARGRAALVGAGTVPDSVLPGDPASFAAAPLPAGCAPLDPFVAAPRVAAAPAPAPSSAEAAGGETTHISVVDGEGNAVALTQTNSSTFGSGARVAGFFLNDSGIDFTRSSLDPAAPGPEWRTRRTTISPTVVLDGGRVRMVVGAPGGGRIPTAIVQNMVYTLDYGLDPLEALRMPRIFPSTADRGVQLETGFDAEVLRGAREMGYEPAALSFGYARLYMIVRQGDHWVAVADPRHNGEARGW